MWDIFFTLIESKVYSTKEYFIMKRRWMSIDVLKSVVTVDSYFHSIMNIVIVTEEVIPSQRKLTHIWIILGSKTVWSVQPSGLLFSISFKTGHNDCNITSSCRLNVNTKLC
jgi:hypothetical protein